MQKYRDIGLKLTPQRLAILDYLDGNKCHPSAEDIYSAVKKKFPTMSFATVYNTLEVLKVRGEVLELTIDEERRRYDPHVSHHHHLICTTCRKIVDIQNEFSITVPDEQKESFDVTGNHIEFYGSCPDCTINEA